MKLFLKVAVFSLFFYNSAFAQSSAASSTSSSSSSSTSSAASSSSSSSSTSSASSSAPGGTEGPVTCDIDSSGIKACVCDCMGTAWDAEGYPVYMGKIVQVCSKVNACKDLDGKACVAPISPTSNITGHYSNCHDQFQLPTEF